MSVILVCVVYKLVLFLPVFLALESPRGPSFAWPDGEGTHQHQHIHDEYHRHSHVLEEQDDVPNNSTVQMPPVEFLRDLSNYEVNDLLINFVEYDDNHPLIEDRFGDVERTLPVGAARGGGFETDVSNSDLAVTPKTATCIPELQTVKIVESVDPTVIYIPECTRIERCGGCCTHALLSCQPKQTELVNFQVTKTQYTGGRKLKFIGKEVIVVERHTKCKCDCKMKAEDCNRFQEYRPQECRCVCMNHDERKKCEKKYDSMLWNPKVCACQCRSTQECSTGYYFDQNECRCLRVPMKRRFAYYELGTRYNKP